MAELSFSDTPGRTLAPPEAVEVLRSLVCQGLEGAKAQWHQGNHRHVGHSLIHSFMQVLGELLW